MELKRHQSSEPGARWLRCDLHVHTPFDEEMKFGEDIRGAIEAPKTAKPQRLARIADRLVQACRNAADGQGLDLVALTDHNSIDGYRYLKSQFETLARQARERDLAMPTILPGGGVLGRRGAPHPRQCRIGFSPGTSSS